MLASGSAARAYACDRRRSAGGLDRPRDDAGRARGSASTVAAEAATHDLDGLVAAVARSDGVRTVTRHHVPHRLRAAGRLRRRLPRRDRADRARRASSSTSRTASRRRRSLQGALVLRHATAVPAGRRPPRGRRSRRRRRPPRGRGRTARRPRLRRARQRPADARGGRRCGIEAAHELANDALPPRARSRAPSTRATSSRRSPRTSPRASRSTISGPSSTRRRSSASTLPEPEVGRVPVLGDRARRSTASATSR